MFSFVSGKIKGVWKGVAFCFLVCEKELYCFADTGKAWLSKTWSLCRPLKNQRDVDRLKAWLNEAYCNLAMVNYPYPGNFLANLPGYPIREFCSRLQAPLSPPEAVLTGLYRGINLYINFTGETKCFDFEQGSPGLGNQGWNYQVCT